MGLRISLADGEKIIVNGAVLRANGRLRLTVENKAAILRGTDVMLPEEANTPARRLYYACMLAYIDEANAESHRDSIVVLLQELIDAFVSVEAKASCARFATLIAGSDYYQALQECRIIMGHEAVVLARG